MRCTDKKKGNRKLSLVLCMTLLAGMLSGCANTAYEIPYEVDSRITSFNVLYKEKPDIAQAFAADVAVVNENVGDSSLIDMSQVGTAALFDLNNNEVLYAMNVHGRMHPASLTKLMTAIVALKYGSVDQVLTATNAVNISESGAQLCGLKRGDTMTLNQALHVMLINSANDAALLIADNIGGSVDRFVEMMNEEAWALGATNTHFANPHGLTAENHYTTAYDMYLIFNEVVKNSDLQEIISTTEYQTTYYDKDKNEKKLTLLSTNRFLKGDFQVPDKVTIVGGKTGTTQAAGHCLVMLTRDVSGALYIAVIMRGTTSDILYTEMIDLLNEIHK